MKVKPPFSNLQMEILRLYENEVSEKDLTSINKLIVNYFAKKCRIMQIKSGLINIIQVNL
jgi:chromosome condensin MukBEF complex kleisin-like MukF subunit